MTEKTEKKEGSEQPAKNKQVLLLLSEELRKKHMTPLRSRFSKLGLTVTIEDIEYPEDKQKNYQWILRFPWNLPKGKSPDPSSAALVFRVLGMAKIQLERLPKTEDKKILTLIDRYKEIQESCARREDNPRYTKLVVTDAVLRAKQQMTKDYTDLVTRLENKISQVEKPYYQGIGYILSTAIEKITGIAILDGLMKGLIRVMIIDDLEKRTVDGLVAIHFSRKYLSFMSTQELAKKYDEFKKEHVGDEMANANIEQFVFNSPDFQEVDIILFNSWNFTEESFPVRIALRKKTILSKQDQRKVDQKDQIEEKIKDEEIGIEKAKVKLKEVVATIRKMEKEHYDDENKYQTQLSARRRIMKDLKRRALKLKEMKKPVKAKDDEMILTFDLFEVFKSKQSLKDKLGDKVGNMGLGNLWSKHVNTDDRFSFNTLSEMSRLSKEWIKVSAQSKKVAVQTQHLSDQLNQYAEQNNLMIKDPKSRTGGAGSYQPAIDDQVIDHIELGAISCEIVNSFEEQRQKAKSRDI